MFGCPPARLRECQPRATATHTEHEAPQRVDTFAQGPARRRRPARSGRAHGTPSRARTQRTAPSFGPGGDGGSTPAATGAPRVQAGGVEQVSEARTSALEVDWVRG